MKKIGRFLCLGLILVMATFLSSCVTPPPKPSPACLPQTRIPPPPAALRQDTYHIVAPGETLWRISKMYDVPAEEVARANTLTVRDPVLRKGQRLFIPDAAPLIPVITLYPSEKWQYIIIHHSATDEGNALFFDKAHLRKGWDGVGYHFVIDNGTKGKRDGQIEVSPRWLKNMRGSHCRADGMNYRAIGICLVGNFSKDQPTPRQMQALVDLTAKLMKYYHISRSRVMGHGQVRGASTECPGTRFPWGEFNRRLNADLRS